MAKKAKQNKKKKKPTRKVPRELVEAADSRASLSATVAWSLILMSTIAAETIGFICQAYAQFVENIPMLRALGGIMLFVALVSGVVTLILTPIVLKLAKHRPPAMMIQTALFAGSLPIIVLVAQLLGG